MASSFSGDTHAPMEKTARQSRREPRRQRHVRRFYPPPLDSAPHPTLLRGSRSGQPRLGPRQGLSPAGGRHPRDDRGGDALVLPAEDDPPLPGGRPPLLSAPQLAQVPGQYRPRDPLPLSAPGALQSGAGVTRMGRAGPAGRCRASREPSGRGQPSARVGRPGRCQASRERSGRDATGSRLGPRAASRERRDRDERFPQPARAARGQVTRSA